MIEVRESTDSFAHGPRRVTVERYEPAGPGPFPAVLVLHGRDGLTGGSPRYRLLARQTAGQGFAAFLVHYFGGARPTREASDVPQFLGWVERVREAITYATSQPCVDARRIGLVGISLGGYLALAVAARDPRVKAVVECCGGLPDPVARELKRMPPVLILHGVDDAVVPVEEAKRLAALLKEKGLPFEQFLYPGEGHTLGPFATLNAAIRTADFLRRHLGPEA